MTASQASLASPAVPNVPAGMSVTRAKGRGVLMKVINKDYFGQSMHSVVKTMVSNTSLSAVGTLGAA